MKTYKKLLIATMMSSLVYGAKSPPKEKPILNAKEKPTLNGKEKSALNGFAVGLQVGYAILKTPAKFSTRSNASSTSNFNASGFFGGLLLGGYSDIGDKMNIGLDVQYSLSNASGTNDSLSLSPNAYKITLKMKDMLTAAVRLGWRMGQVVPYLKMGGSSAALEARAQVPAAFASGNPVAVKKQRCLGYLGGVGVDFSIDGCTTIGVETLVSKYKNFKMVQSLQQNTYTYSFNPLVYSTSVVMKCFF